MDCLHCMLGTSALIPCIIWVWGHILVEGVEMWLSDFQDHPPLHWAFRLTWFKNSCLSKRREEKKEWIQALRASAAIFFFIQNRIWKNRKFPLMMPTRYFSLYFWFCCYFLERGSSDQKWLETHYAVQGGLKLTELEPPGSNLINTEIKGMWHLP